MRQGTLLLVLLCGGCNLDSGWSTTPPGRVPDCVWDYWKGCSSGGGGGASVPMLSFSVQPSGATVGAVITPTVRVRVFSATGTRDYASDSLTITLSTNPGGATLSGATLVVVNGDATFPNLSIDKPGEGYRLTATAAGFAPVVSAEFNVVTCTCWSSEPPMPTSRGNLGVGAVNGIVYAIGGGSYAAFDWWGFSYLNASQTVDAYDPVARSWRSQAAMPTSRGHLGVGVVNGVLYAVGGAASRSFTPTVLATVEAYDPVANSWATKAPLPTPRSALAVGVVNGVLYAVGGSESSGLYPTALATVEAYDPAADRWTTKAPMPTPRSALAVGVVNGILYAVGGVGDGYTLATVEAYDPAANSWTTKAPMPTARSSLAVGVVNGLLYAVGGSSNGGTVEAYTPAANSWTSKGPMPTPRSGLAMGVVNGVIYAVGGHNGVTLTTVEAYDAAQER